MIFLLLAIFSFCAHIFARQIQTKSTTQTHIYKHPQSSNYKAKVGIVCIVFAPMLCNTRFCLVFVIYIYCVAKTNKQTSEILIHINECVYEFERERVNERCSFSPSSHYGIPHLVFSIRTNVPVFFCLFECVLLL